MQRKLAGHLFAGARPELYLLIIKWTLRASRATPATPPRVSSVEAWRTWRPHLLFPEPCV